jgi:hypothetical protein
MQNDCLYSSKVRVRVKTALRKNVSCQRMCLGMCLVMCAG